MDQSFYKLLGIDRSEETESNEEREDRLALERLRSYYEQIDDQLEHLEDGLDFYTQHEADFCPEGHLSEILMKLDIAGCGPLLVKLFPELELEGDIEKDAKTLNQIDQAEIDRRWQAFLNQAKELTERMRANHLTDTASWVLGQDTSPVPAHHNPDQPKQDWKFFHETPDINNLVALMTVEKLTKRFSEDQDDNWLAEDHKPTEIQNDVDRKDVNRVFGEQGPDVLYGLLTEKLRGAITKIELVPSQTSAVIKAHGEAHQIQLDGGFDREEKIMKLVISPDQNIDRILETWFHELGHAMISSDTKIDQTIRTRFAHTVVTSGKLMQGYASGVYDSEGIERGLEEDFAETACQFFLSPDELKRENPDRYNIFLEVCTEFIPGFSLEEMQQKLESFIQNIKKQQAA